MCDQDYRLARKMLRTQRQVLFILRPSQEISSYPNSSRTLTDHTHGDARFCGAEGCHKRLRGQATHCALHTLQMAAEEKLHEQEAGTVTAVAVTVPVPKEVNMDDANPMMQQQSDQISSILR